jgi:hypothetical protein
LVVLVEEFDGADHCLVINGGEFGNDLEEYGMFRVGGGVVGGEDGEDVPVDIECVLEFADLIHEVAVSLLLQLLIVHLI